MRRAVSGDHGYHFTLQRTVGTCGRLPPAPDCRTTPGCSTLPAKLTALVLPWAGRDCLSLCITDQVYVPTEFHCPLVRPLKTRSLRKCDSRLRYSKGRLTVAAPPGRRLVNTSGRGRGREIRSETWHSYYPSRVIIVMIPTG